VDNPRHFTGSGCFFLRFPPGSAAHIDVTRGWVTCTL
jgi:hypothetical protein